MNDITLLQEKHSRVGEVLAAAFSANDQVMIDWAELGFGLTRIEVENKELKARVDQLKKYAVHKQWPIHGGMDYGERCERLMPTMNPAIKRGPCDCGLDDLMESKI